MPNWCMNRVRVDKKHYKQVKEAMCLTDKGKEFPSFKKRYPLPEELNRTTLQIPNEELKKKYGADNWYDWQVMNWGVKWDCSDGYFDDYNCYILFQTPWGPPDKFLEKISREFPDAEIVDCFADEFLSGCHGKLVFKEGKITEDVSREGSRRFWSKIWGYA